MKISLYHLLMTYGEVIEIAIRPTANLRGQAFATFRDQDMADRAMKELAGFIFYGNKIVNYSLLCVLSFFVYRTFNTLSR